MESKRRENLSTTVAEMKIIVLSAGGFVLYPAKDETEEDKAVNLHRHAHYEFFFSCGDKISIMTEEGEQTFCKKVVIVPPTLIHCCSGSGEGCYCVSVKGEPHARFFDAFKDKEITVIELTDDMAFCLKKIVDADLSTGLGRARAETAIKLLFLEIGESTMDEEESAKKERTNEDNYPEQIETFISNHYNNEKVSIQMLAEVLYLSPKQTSRIIRKEYGCSFPELINQKRMSVAAMLLKSTNLSVADVIDRLNFNSENYFYKLFKTYYGVTPLKYRNQKQTTV